MAGEGYSFSKPKASELAEHGPTIEQYVNAGYPAVNYPPDGYAARESAGLTALRAWQQDEHDAVKHAAAATALGVTTGELVHGKHLAPVVPVAPADRDDVPVGEMAGAAVPAVDTLILSEPIDTPQAPTELENPAPIESDDDPNLGDV